MLGEVYGFFLIKVELFVLWCIVFASPPKRQMRGVHPFAQHDKTGFEKLDPGQHPDGKHGQNHAAMLIAKADGRTDGRKHPDHRCGGNAL